MLKREMVRMVIAAAALVILSNSVIWAAQFTVPRYPCQPVAGSPGIDGVLGDLCWSQLPAVGTFVDAGKIPSTVQTSVKLCYDANTLYAAMVLNEPNMESISAKKTQHDSGMGEDDDIELIITAKKDFSPFFVFCINPDGVTEERRDFDSAAQWNGKWDSAVKRSDKGWTVEIAIPFSTLETAPPQPGDIWRVNVVRNRTQASCASTWSPVMPFWDCYQFGEILFLKEKIFNEVLHEIKIDTRNVQVSFSAKGVPGKYAAKFLWEDKDSKTEQIPLAITDSNAAAASQTYPAAEGTQRSQVECVDGNTGLVVYRSPAITLSSISPAAAMLKKIAPLIEQINKTKTPQFYMDAKKSLCEDYQKAQLHPNESDVSQLLHQCQMILWHSQLPVKWQNQSVIWFSLPPFTAVDYQYIPDSNAIGSKVSLAALRGEYEPACLNLLVADKTKDVLIGLGDLISEKGDVLHADTIDIKVLKHWYQAGITLLNDGDRFTPELLLKNDSMVAPDPVRKRNTILSVEDSEELKPVHIERFQTRQFWLTCHIPNDQKAGRYEGVIEATADGQSIASVPFEITVLPLSMEKTDFTLTMYNGDLLTGDPSKDTLYEADLEQAAAHGCTSWQVSEGTLAQTDANGYVTKFDFAQTQKALELRKKNGLTGKTFDMGAHWYTQPIDAIYRLKEEQLTAQPQHKANMLLYCKGLRACYEQAGIDGYYYTWDEPGYDVTGKCLRMTKIINDWSHQAGMKVAQAITVEGAEKLGNTDIPILDLPSGVIGDKRRTLPFKEAWYYWHPTEDPMAELYLAGMMIWYGGYTGAAPWVYKNYEIWDDWEVTRRPYRTCSYVYSGKTRPVICWQYEALREGFDNIKYLEMLNRRVTKADNIDLESLSMASLETLKQAKELLDIPPVKFRGGVRTVPGTLTSQDFAQFREHILHLLVEMDKIAKK